MHYRNTDIQIQQFQCLLDSLIELGITPYSHCFYMYILLLSIVIYIEL